MTLGAETDAFEMPLARRAPMRPGDDRGVWRHDRDGDRKARAAAGMLPGAGGLTVELASTALVGLGEAARYLDEYPYHCAEQKASRALALLLASDLGGAFGLAGVKPASTAPRRDSALNELYSLSVRNGGFSLWSGAVRQRRPRT